MVEGGPCLVRINEPKPNVVLLTPPTVTNSAEPLLLLQGVIQRVELAFYSYLDVIKNGKLYLSADPTPISLDEAVFWYPDISEVIGQNVISDTELDSIPFHPLALSNTTMQPSEPIIIPYQDRNQLFVIPLFLRSEIPGDIKIKLKLEYIPMAHIQTRTVSIEFDLFTSVVKPFAINFCLQSYNDTPRGVDKTICHNNNNNNNNNNLNNLPNINFINTNNILRGDVINVSVSIACINSLSYALDILCLRLSDQVLDGDGEDENEDKVQIQNSNFEIMGGIRGCDMLRDVKDFNICLCDSNCCEDGVNWLSSEGNDAMSCGLHPPDVNNNGRDEGCYITLKRGELFAGLADVLCLPTKLPSMTITSGCGSSNMDSEDCGSRIRSKLTNSYAKSTSDTDDKGNIAIFSSGSGNCLVSEIGCIELRWRLHANNLLANINLEPYKALLYQSTEYNTFLEQNSQQNIEYKSDVSHNNDNSSDRYPISHNEMIDGTSDDVNTHNRVTTSNNQFDNNSVTNSKSDWQPNTFDWLLPLGSRSVSVFGKTSMSVSGVTSSDITSEASHTNKLKGVDKAMVATRVCQMIIPILPAQVCVML